MQTEENFGWSQLSEHQKLIVVTGSNRFPRTDSRPFLLQDCNEA